MIELLGVGLQGAQNAWRLRKVCARFDRGALSAVVTGSPADGAALLDALTGRRIPDEGRIWVTRLPLMRETRGRVRALVGEATATAVFVTHRSVLWNTRVVRGTVLGRLLSLGHHAQQPDALRALVAVGLDRRAGDPLVALSPADRLRVAVARTLIRRPAAVVLREVDAALEAPDAGSLLGTLRRLARSHRLIAVVSLASIELARAYADRVLVLTGGTLVPDTPPQGPHAPSPVRQLQSVFQGEPV